MRVEVAAFWVAVAVVAAAVTIDEWNPNWQLKSPDAVVRVTVRTEAPRSPMADPARRAEPPVVVASAPPTGVESSGAAPPTGQLPTSQLPTSQLPTSQPLSNRLPEPGQLLPNPPVGTLTPDTLTPDTLMPDTPAPDAPAPDTLTPDAPAQDPPAPDTPMTDQARSAAAAGLPPVDQLSADKARPPVALPRVAAPAPVPEAIRAAVAEPDPFRPQSGNLSVARVDYDDLGEVILEGSASPGSTVRVRLNGRTVGEAPANAEGRWRLQPERPIAAGQYALQADELSLSGGTAASVTLPFAKADNAADLPRPDRLVVQPGNSLWRLAERLYGDGFQYALIFDANRDQIVNPDLIYPGQIVRIPPTPTRP